jgi:hypothetical protein
VIASAYSPLLILLLLACPLMMIFMMRGHGHAYGQDAAGHGGHHDSNQDPTERPSLEELRARVDELEAQISAREDEEAERLTVTR